VPLDDVQRHALARELERVRVAELVRREPAPDARACGDLPKLVTARGRSTAGNRGWGRR
jgi:hypothetical protein